MILAEAKLHKNVLKIDKLRLDSEIYFSFVPSYLENFGKTLKNIFSYMKMESYRISIKK